MNAECQNCGATENVRHVLIGAASGEGTLRSLQLCDKCEEAQKRGELQTRRKPSP